MVSLGAGGWLTIFLLSSSCLTGLSLGLLGRALRFGLYCCGTTLRVRVFLTDALSFSSVPGPSGDRSNMPLMAAWGLVAGSAACCMQCIRCCPMVPVQVRSLGPPATTVGEWWRHHAL